MEPDTTSTATSQALRIPMPNDGYVYRTQVVVRGIVWIIRLLLSRKVVVDIKIEQLEPDCRYLLTPNHGSWLDPLVIMHHLPGNVFKILGPIRVIVGNRLLASPLKPFILSLGSFPAKPHKYYRSGIEMAQYFLDNGALLAIFPEGRRNANRSVKPRRGVADLANAEDVRLIPVHIEWTRHFFGIIPTYKIHIGAPVKVMGKTAEEIMDVIYALPLA
jgi:1-acyl-sn-glycerol-3-phosphate acyltransferase